MIDVRLSTGDDIRHVVYRMWRRGLEELSKHGNLDNEHVIRVLHDRSREYGYAIYYHEEPVVVFGAHAVSDMEYHTWFAATDNFHHIGREVTKFLRNLIKEQTEDRPDAVLILCTAVDHPDADRWFRFLGFEPIKPEGIFNRYLHVKRKRLTDTVESANIRTTQAVGDIRHVDHQHECMPCVSPLLSPRTTPRK